MEDRLRLLVDAGVIKRSTLRINRALFGVKRATFSGCANRVHAAPSHQADRGSILHAKPVGEEWAYSAQCCSGYWHGQRARLQFQRPSRTESCL
jgi:hypothetical protein